MHGTGAVPPLEGLRPGDLIRGTNAHLSSLDQVGEGALVTVYPGAEWTPQDVLHDLEALVAGS